MRKLKAALVGAGDRGCIYANYSLQCPDELEIVAVVEPHEIRRKEAQEKYKIAENRVYVALEDFIKDKVECDFVINATMDEFHFETASMIMTAGYNMLMEKPIVAEKDKLLQLWQLSKKMNVKVSICHVLRYTPFYKTIKEIINSGKIGEIMTMEMNEHVGMRHFLTSFVRGPWKSTKECGSSFLLQKSCHDMDVGCWLNNKVKPVKVLSVGSRSNFVLKNAPKNATKYCYNCPVNAECDYSAQKLYVEDDSVIHEWGKLNKPIAEITRQEKEEYLKTHDIGLCAYNSGGDINDRQAVTVEFENGSIMNFTMVGAVNKPDRYIHVIGTKGEIEGYFSTGKISLRIFNSANGSYESVEEEIDTSKVTVSDFGQSLHGGGDYAIMYEFVRFMQGEITSVSNTTIDDSIYGHLVVYAADESVKSNKAEYITIQ